MVMVVEMAPPDGHGLRVGLGSPRTLQRQGFCTFRVAHLVACCCWPITPASACLELMPQMLMQTAILNLKF
jgi:hypothetical protein